MSSQYRVQGLFRGGFTQGVSSIGDARKKLGVNLVVEGSWDFAGNQVMRPCRRNHPGAARALISLKPVDVYFR
jgi:hypothetical protein